MTDGGRSTRTGLWIGLAGVGGFCASLFLPAARVQGYGEIDGWEAFVYALWTLGDALYSRHQSCGPFLVGGAALCNLGFVSAPLVLLRWSAVRFTSRLITILSALGLVLGLLLPHVRLGETMQFLIGYELWLAAFACVLLASVPARRAT